MPVFSLSRGIPYKLLDADSTAAPVKSPGVYVPQAGNYDVRNFGWVTRFASNPASVSISIQGAENDVDAEYVTLDTSTVVGGEARVVTGKAFNFLRANVTARSGGSGVTVEVTV